MTLYVSRDGGVTWGDAKPKALGPVGNYAGRMIWRQLGQARRWAFKVRVSDPVEVQISSKGRIA